MQAGTASSQNIEDQNPPIINNHSKDRNAPIIYSHGAAYNETQPINVIFFSCTFLDTGPLWVPAFELNEPPFSNKSLISLSPDEDQQ